MRVSPAITAPALASLGMALAARADAANAKLWIVLEADAALKLDVAGVHTGANGFAVEVTLQ